MRILSKQEWIAYMVFLSLTFLSACKISDEIKSPELVPIATETHQTWETPTQTQTQTQTKTIQTSQAPSTIFSPQPTPTTQVDGTITLWAASYLPKSLVAELVDTFELEIMEDHSQAEIVLDVGDENQITSLIFCLAAPFPTITDNVSFTDISESWNAQEGFSGIKLLVSPNTLMTLSKLWGPPTGEGVIILPEEQILEFAWEYPFNIALIPFEDLTPQWKVLAIDGISPIWKNFNSSEYKLSVPISLTEVNTSKEEEVLMYMKGALKETYNRDPDKLTTVILTGVTAMVRATASEMEKKGITYPGEDIRGLLMEADFLHISNEVPFAEECPKPDPYQKDVTFCSDPKYIELLEFVGADVIELTGDHTGDWGEDAFLFTLNMYRERGWLYYGGGESIEEGRQAITVEHNGNSIAFIGCNAKGGIFTPSTRGQPGAVHCDYNNLYGEIARLKSEGYIVIATFQHYEFYSFLPSEELMVDFQNTAEAGADIVSGSQAHQPHIMEFYNGSMLMYGLGNLFFDQVWSHENTNKALIARYVIYDGRYISTELFTIYFSDYSRPRIMNEEDRIQLLIDVFTAGGW